MKSVTSTVYQNSRILFRHAQAAAVTFDICSNFGYEGSVNEFTYYYQQL